ncbi:hypothetical protein Tco_0392379 [Tanacetum coccineum]
MADAEHAPAMAPPVRTDEQILPRIRWVPIGKSNCYLNEEKSQPSPIYKIAVDILKQTNFFRAFTASSTIPAIYIQQFWDTICFDSKAGSYKCQLDEQWFDLTKDTLRDALQITASNLKFSAKGTKREVFGMTIPNESYNDVIRGADYYDAYLKKGVILQRFLEKILTYAYPNSKRGSSPPVYFNEPDDLETSNHCQRFRSGAQDEGQAGPDLGTLDKGQAGPNLDDVAESQPLPTPSVLAGPNLEHSDVEITDPSSQPRPEHMDEGFTAASYPNVTTRESKANARHLCLPSYDVTGDRSRPRQDSPNVHGPLPTTTTTTVATTTTTLPPPPQPQQGPSDPILIKRMGELEEFIANLMEENQALKTRLDKQGSRINKLETMDLPKIIKEQTVDFIDSQEIDQNINESVKEVVISSVKHAMRAPLHARFKDLPTSLK